MRGPACISWANPTPFSLQTRCSPKFAFAEFRSVEEASAGLNLAGIIYKTHPLSVQRPRSGPPGAFKRP